MTDTARDLRSHFGLTTIPFTREIAVEDRWPAPLFDEPLLRFKPSSMFRSILNGSKPHGFAGRGLNVAV